jgi:3-dehydroquinate dehydratase type I
MMNLQKIATPMSRILRGGACVVAAVHSPASLAIARKLRPGDADFLELRIDAFASEPEQLLRAAPKLPLPLIVTVRHRLEGAALPLPDEKRRELFEQFLPHAALVDIELRSAKKLASVLDAAHRRGARVILSHHNFNNTPTLPRLRELAARARSAGADIFKIAAVASRPRDLATLLDFLTREKPPLPLSVMAMGRFGKISRLLFAETGSVLNYGFLDKAKVSGQWPAKLLKTRLEELAREDQTAKVEMQK